MSLDARHFVCRAEKCEDHRSNPKLLSPEQYEDELKRTRENQQIRKMFKVQPESGIIKANKCATLTISFFPTTAVDFKRLPVFKFTFLDSISNEPKIEPTTLLISSRTFTSR